jgi:hypothetical protein
VAFALEGAKSFAKQTPGYLQTASTVVQNTKVLFKSTSSYFKEIASKYPGKVPLKELLTSNRWSAFGKPNNAGVSNLDSSLMKRLTSTLKSKLPIPDAKRLRPSEQVTAGRLMEQKGLKLRESLHEGAEYIDDLGKTYDALGTPQASKYWNEKQFLGSIDHHLLKSNDFTAIDLAGFTPKQINIVESYVNSFPLSSQKRLIILK